MELKQFDGQKKSELSLIEVAHAILSQHGDVMAFADLTNAVQSYLGKSDEEIRERLSQFYTDLNIDGSFISLGDNMWGLRAWYPFESIDEAVIHTDDEEDEDRPKRKKRKKVNAFLADAGDDDDVIDYDDDDPEDDDNYEDDDDANSDDDDDDDSASSKYDELAGVDDSDDDAADETLPDGIEGQLSELNDDDDDDYDDEEDDEENK
ncbi:DNA-directed RNA polymerase subunit delta [Lactiplantibacillus fabifermentans]|uniref:Probable DNA-directed RNA polymerase subunit delta n=2 Tax=Lactiplantibacillus fabifermentans TaxID=483011 RepID=A0A0R2NK97_9LACO|nr:DNA-directed RNA polymerase subunit delta [Lactiplantibacillus fabifermentans]ETY75324.1 DNA-directed RNA polymerase subunit delta [Lactiplantibacillus fabifermentans T30PCM01]KRO25019.1 rpoE protein [Lactiplantibacillus fabifermentans DSM 21115]